MAESIHKARPLTELKTAWQFSSLGTESTLHQLAPYIGKMKTTLARALIENYTSPNHIVIDPFCGSGVVPLEALLLGRGVIANDINPYAAVLTRAKLHPITQFEQAEKKAIEYIRIAKSLVKQGEYQDDAPKWVQSFFNPKTLAETETLADALFNDKEWFLLANLLGILHHQRPGFLSYPSSHLVPYLRDKKFPRNEFPEMYAYRDVEPRLVRKLQRTFRRLSTPNQGLLRTFTSTNVNSFTPPQIADVAITSPPYMNALDYGRDNRLRLWFITKDCPHDLDAHSPKDCPSFSSLMANTASLLGKCVRPGGRAILVIGDIKRKSRDTSTRCLVKDAFERITGGWTLIDEVDDPVPDIRRSRRGCAGTKTEWVLTFARD